MPIYDGEWYDDWEKPFDRNAVAYPNNRQGRRASRRRKLLSRTASQTAVAESFRHAAWLWQTKISGANKAQWNENATTKDWHCRDGVRKSMPGFAFFLRSTLTQILYHEPLWILLHLSHEPPWCTLTDAYWSPSTQRVYLTFDNPVPTIDYEFSSLSVYQLDPNMPSHFDAPDASRWIGHVCPWPTTAPALWNGPLAWPATPGVNMYLYARWHQDLGFEGLTFPVPWPPPVYDGTLTGTLDPDITGGFVEDGLYSGAMSYKHASLEWYICVFPWLPFWHIAEEKSQVGTRGWTKMQGDTAAGVYNPYGTASGTATFTID